MEVFMRNVPHHLTDQSLNIQLKDKIKSIGIHDWSCKKRPNKNIGTIVFHTRDEGCKFLRQYGEAAIPGAPLRNGKARTQAKLRLLGNMVYCNESKHAPEPLALKVLDMQVEKREETKNLEKEINTNATMNLTGVSCGHYDYLNSKIAFMVDMKIACTGEMKFARTMLIVKYHEFGNTYRVEIPYRIIHEVIASTQPSALAVTLWESPRFFSMASSQSQDQHGLIWKRITGLPHQTLNHSRFVGQSLVYQFSTSSVNLHHEMEKVAGDKGLFCTSYRAITTIMSPVPMGDAMAELIGTFGLIESHVPFDVAYQFHALARGGYILPLTIQSLLLRLNKYSINAARAKNSRNISSFCPFSAAAVKKLFLIDFAGPGTEAAIFQPDALWNKILEYEHAVRHDLSRDLISDRASNAAVLVYKVQVTPTRVMFSGPELEPNNRVLRKYKDYTEYFARVQLCEEDGQDMFFNPRVDMEDIWSRFKEVLGNGIQICGRIYEFLGFSHSSLRAHAVWAMASFNDTRTGTSRSYFNVISELGIFDKIKAPARRAARIGQAFSDTRFTVPLIGVAVQYIPDVKSADGKRVFSDGVGTISRGLLELIREELPGGMQSATCFQIRWAGVKGMLSLDDTLPGSVMRIRKESMVKFESTDKENLEICDAANKATPLFLNRQMIKILEDMGVPDSWFLKEQAIEVSRLRKITADVTNTATFLRRQKIGDQMRFSGFLKKLHQLGFNYKTDRFLCTVIEAVILRELRLLKNKARIPVEKGVTLFGVMDEFNFLEEGEIFVAFDELEGTHFLDLHERECIVTRSPALHPGDIQLCRNVVPPDYHPLRSLKNCIVFSQRGTRDLPSQLSGGDLDGDKFSVLWDETAVSKCIRISSPADYPRVTPLELNREVQVGDMIDFFIQFMATDQLGLIATRHLIYADQLEDGAGDPKCTKLAELHSTAVDYSKTGVPVSMQDLRDVGSPRHRPDFMSPSPPANLKDRSEIEFEKPLLPPDETDEDDQTGPQFHFYKSDRALGHLFRNIDERKIWQEDIQMFASRKGPTLWERLLHFIKRSCVEHRLGNAMSQNALAEADVILQMYNNALEGLTKDFSENSGEPITEVEIFTGSIFNPRGLPTKRQGERSLQLKEEFDRVTRWIESLIRRQKMPDYIEEEEEYNEHTNAQNGSQVGAGVAATQHFTSAPLELSIACLRVALMKKVGTARKSHRFVVGGNFESFKIIAASCALRELDRAVQRQNATVWLS